MRKKHNILFPIIRIIALLLAVVLIFASMDFIGSLAPTITASAEESTTSSALNGVKVRNDALHFIIRHWHTQEDTDARLQGNQAGQDEDTQNYFVIAEGYIVPTDNTTGERFEFYFVSSAGDEKELISIKEIEKYDESYVGDHNPYTGSITLNTKVLVNENQSALERFSGFSISAGHDAVEYNEVKAGEEGTPSITITYSEYVHLVKGHVFYVRASKVVKGSNDASLLGYSDQIDTAEVYTYIKDGDKPVPHAAGDIVMLEEEGKACETLEEVLKAGAKESDVELTKFYSTTKGLHTDNALLVQDKDGRLYQFDLSAWYTQGIASQVGLILDASGGFGYAYDYPDPINVSSLSDEEKLLLGKKINGVANENERAQNDKYLYPQRDEMIGYYEVASNNGEGNYRTWYFNSIDPNDGKYINPDKTNIPKPSEYSEEYFAGAVYPQVNSGTFDFSNSQAIREVNDFLKIEQFKNDYYANGSSPTWSTVPLSFSSSSGINIAGSAGAYGDSAFVLSEASTPSGSFTVSFIAEMKTWGDNDAEILYIGAKSNDFNSAEFRLVRTNKQLVLHHGGTATTLISDYTTTAKQTFTFTYDGDKNIVMFYVNGGFQAIVKDVSINSECVVFNPFKDNVSNGSSNNFSVDDIFVYDTVLDINEVSRLVAAHDSQKGVDEASAFTWDNIFLNESQLALLLNTRKTDNSLNGWGDYSYFVHDTNYGEFTALAYWDGTKKDSSKTGYDTLYGADGKVRAGTSTNVNGKGWYYTTSSSYDVANAAGTAKRAYGMSAGTYYDDTDRSDADSKTYGSTPDYPEGYTWEQGTDSGRQYTASGNSSVKFYIDDKGNLRCFFAKSDSHFCSYVYELPDDKYVKTEAMQRILGNFATMLIDQSPATEVSALQFRAVADTKEKREKLVLLDWSSDASDIAGLMSMRYGEGGFNDYKVSANNVKQYNYALTGGSYIYSALQSFQDNLLEHDNDDAARFIIIITDGKDDNESLTVSEAKKLRDEGYTIMSVMFGGTTFNESLDEYWQTYEHLSRISGTKDYQGEDYVFRADDLESLMKKFSDEILKTIAQAIEGYTVKNYIDPRFNVVGSDGTEYIFGAGGKVEKVVVGKGTTEIVLSDTSTETVSLAGTTDSRALTPYLRYDKSKDMYYLEWVDQVIPTSAEGAPLLGVWSAQFTLKAKDDFIGGNAVLTNGNDEGMNYLYSKNDQNPSSGTDKMYDTKYPSKGFPRTTVNVPLTKINTYNLSSTLYMGEVVSPAQLLTDIEGTIITDSYYLEYLKRYAYQRYLYNKNDESFEDANMPLLKLLHDWLEFDNESELQKSFSIPYMYLPSVAYDAESGKIDLENGYAKTVYNNAGNTFVDSNGVTRFNADTADVLGILTYRWEQIEPSTENPDDPTKDYVKSDTERLQYGVTVGFTPLREGDTLEDLNAHDDDGDDIFASYIPISNTSGNNIKTTWDGFEFKRENIVNKYVADDSFKWNPEYKPAKYYKQQLEAVLDNYTDTKDTVQLINEGQIVDEETGEREFEGDPRTLKGYSIYTLDTVSGGVALELKMLTGELEIALGDSNTFEITLDATRTFTDTEFAQSLKKEKDLDDYGSNFKVTFQFNYTAEQVEELVPDKYGYVNVFAKAIKIEGTFGKSNDNNVELHELPIGTYKFTLSNANENVKTTPALQLSFTSISHESEVDKFDTAYFDDLVLNGCNTTNEYPVQKPDEFEQEIDNDNIDKFIAQSNSNNKTATFYIGTSIATDPNRGNVGSAEGEKRYTEDRLAIVVLSTGTTNLTIVEDGKNSSENESFVYLITGTTLGGEEVELIVSVKGGCSTTIAILAGDYTVTEISDWSWKYEDGVSSPTVGAWEVNGKTASIQLRTDTKAVVTFSHELKNKPWLGEESSESYLFE